MELQALVPDSSIFLDSDDLFDLRALLGDVADSEVLVLLQSTGILTRPWCLLEIVTAIKNEVPIVCVNVLGPNRYDFSSAFAFMTHLDSELDRVNPGASKLIADQGVDMLELAFLISHTIPNCISVDLNPHGSSNSIKASMMDLVEAMEKAEVRPISVSLEEWVSSRGLAPQHPGQCPGQCPADTAARAEDGSAPKCCMCIHLIEIDPWDGLQVPLRTEDFQRLP